MYLNNLFFADGAYHNASAIEDYINEETVIEEPGRSVLADAIPGILVSLGFLGTLIGLSTGLANFSMEDSSAVQISIETLIPSMRYAFMTSIFGVIGSIFFTMIVRMTNGFASHALTEFYSAMKGRAGVLSVDPMTQVAIYQQEQTALIQKLERELSASIEAGIRPLQKSLNEFMSVSTSEQMRFLNAVVERFVDQMDQSLKGQLRNFAVTLDETCRHHEEVQESYKANLAQLERMAREIAQYEKLSDQMVGKLDGYLNRLSAAQSRLEDSYRRVSSSVEQMEGVAQKQNNYLQTSPPRRRKFPRQPRSSSRRAKNTWPCSARISKNPRRRSSRRPRTWTPAPRRWMRARNPWKARTKRWWGKSTKTCAKRWKSSIKTCSTSSTSWAWR